MAETVTTLPLGIDREIHFNKQVNQDSIGEVVKKILDVNKNDEYLKKFYNINGLVYVPKPIEIYIDSYGGYAYQMMGLIGVMEKSITPIHTITTGVAMSCGFMILISGHKRFAYSSATMMYHQVWSGMFGKVQELEEELIETKRLQKFVETITLKKTRMTKSMLQNNKEKKQDWFITATEAFKLGIIDKII